MPRSRNPRADIVTTQLFAARVRGFVDRDKSDIFSRSTPRPYIIHRKQKSPSFI